MFSFEHGPHAPRISEGTAQSKQGPREEKSLLFKICAGQEPGGEGPGTAAAASVIQPRSIQLRRSCPGDCRAAGKERSLSAPLSRLARAAALAEPPFRSFLSA